MTTNKKSNCCNKATQVKGDTTKYYVCTLCDKACDVGVEFVTPVEFDHKHYIPKNTPMGVSEWKEHGKKYGYDEYFKKDYIPRQVVEAEIDSLERMKKGVGIGSQVVISHKIKALQLLTNK